MIRAGPTDSFCNILTFIKGGQYGTIELNSWLNEADGVERALVGKTKTSLCRWDRYEHDGGVPFIWPIR